MKQLFRHFYVVKPESSRASSAEAFVVGLKYQAGKDLSQILSSSMMGLKETLNGAVKESPEEGEDEDCLTF